MAKLVISGAAHELEELMGKPAESSVAPLNFTHASPFPRRKQKNDRIRTVILAAAAGALLVFLGSIMIAVLMMRAPVP
jgi:hypothetical protein